MAERTLMITGASGGLGRAAVQHLLTLGQDKVVAGTRDLSKLADLAAKGVDVRVVDFDDPSGLVAAFEGVDRLLLVSTDAVGEPGRRAQQHKNAIAAAKSAGVKHLLYTSFSNPAEDSVIPLADDHRATEQALEASGIPYTTLRNNLYAELLLQSLPTAVESGQFITARGEGKIAYVSRADCARIAAAALADDVDETRVVEVSGPEAVSGEEVAAIFSKVSGKTITHVSIPAASLEAGMIDGGLPAPFAKLLVAFEVGADKGELKTVSPAVEQLTGRAPLSVSQVLQAAAS